MSSTEIIGASAAGLFILTCGVVGGRLLWLSWRTRQLPELCIGLGLFSVVAIGFPVMVASGVGVHPVARVNLPVLAIGLLALLVGTTCLYAFTWRVFRRNSAWAAAVVALACAGFAVVAVGIVSSIRSAPPEMSSFEAARDWMAGIRVAILGSYLWAAIESALEYRMARRRLALGLSDPVVVNRLLLWCLTGCLEVLINAVDLTLHMLGLSPVSHAGAMSVTATGGLVASAMMYLTFLPPSRYLDWVQRRATAHEAALQA